MDMPGSERQLTPDEQELIDWVRKRLSQNSKKHSGADEKAIRKAQLDAERTAASPLGLNAGQLRKMLATNDPVLLAHAKKGFDITKAWREKYRKNLLKP